MDRAIISYYNDRSFQLRKLIKKGAGFGLTKKDVMNAMVHCYRKIEEGKSVADIDLWRYVVNVAKDHASEDYMDKELAGIEAYIDENHALKRIIAFMGALVIALSIYIGYVEVIR